MDKPELIGKLSKIYSHIMLKPEHEIDLAAAISSDQLFDIDSLSSFEFAELFESEFGFRLMDGELSSIPNPREIFLFLERRLKAE